jgi:hypothetical protein
MHVGYRNLGLRPTICSLCASQYALIKISEDKFENYNLFMAITFN